MVRTCLRNVAYIQDYMRVFEAMRAGATQVDTVHTCLQIHDHGTSSKQLNANVLKSFL